MPELPEVETVVRGLQPHLAQQVIQQVVVRCDKLRWPISENLPRVLPKQTVHAVARRGKYVLLHCDTGTLLIHLGMSGKLRLLTHAQPAQRHDHVDILFAHSFILRYTDPRRFGAILWTQQPLQHHFLLEKLGPEPLDSAFNADYFYQKIGTRSAAIKILVMSPSMVVGIGNIYATEALFLAGIHPATPASQLARADFPVLVAAIQHILNHAIQCGGTTLKDFVNSTNQPGYFSQQLKVYGRAGKACAHCGCLLESMVLGQRSSVFCPHCQPRIG